VALSVKSGSEAVQKAKGWIGTAYCWGGGHGGPVPVGTCVDCSGLVNQVYGTTGTTFTQVAMGSSVPSIADAGPGDLVFFGPLAPGEPHHVGIYVGNNQMIDAPHTGTSVRQESIQGFGPINAVRRLVPTTAGTGTGVGAAGPMFNYAQLEGIWILAGGNAQQAAMAAAIAMAESGGNANASGTNNNGSIDRGLWQINSSNGSMSSFDVMTNARAAIFMSNGGMNWRPWCTAYSDGACGTRGGCYQCPGSPYLKFLNPAIAPDTNVNINATNAAANIGPGTPQAAQLTASFSPFCILHGPQECMNQGGSSADALVGGIINGIMHSIINPILQPIAGVLGITAGAVLMAGGAWMLVGRPGAGIAGQGIRGAAILAGGPEIGAVVGRTGGERAAYVSMTSQQRAQRAREQGRTQAANIRTQQAGERIQEQAVREQLRRESMAYREWLMRTRPPRGGGPPPPRQGQPPPREGGTRAGGRRVIPVRSSRVTRMG